MPGEWSGSFRGMYRGAGVPAVQMQVFESDRDRAIVELRRMQIRIVGGGVGDGVE